MVERKIRTYGDVELSINGETLNFPRGIYTVVEWNKNRLLRVSPGFYIEVEKVFSSGTWGYLTDDPDYQACQANPHLTMTDFM